MASLSSGGDREETIGQMYGGKAGEPGVVDKVYVSLGKVCASSLELRQFAYACPPYNCSAILICKSLWAGKAGKQPSTFELCIKKSLLYCKDLLLPCAAKLLLRCTAYTTSPRSSAQTPKHFVLLYDADHDLQPLQLL